MSKTKELPIPVGWKVIVRPRSAKTMSDGGIDVSATEDAQEHLVYMGELVAVGEAAFTSRTAGGLDMAAWKARPEVGDTVFFAPYGGLQIRQRGEKKPLRLLNDTDILGIAGDPDMYYSWIDV
jgi:co-chaperonin GroES (HSP10)